MAGIERADLLELIANTSDGVFVVDADQRIILWNQAVETLLGFPAQEVLGRFCYEVLGGRAPAGHLVCQKSCRTYMMAKRSGLAPTHDLATRTKDGREIWLNVTTLVIPGRWRNLETLVHIFRDVSRQKEVERFVEQLLSSVARLSWPQGVEPLPDPVAGDPSVDHSRELTGREVEVLQFLASGTSTKAIAEKLGISPSTVKNHTQNILAKLKVHSRLEAVALAFRYGLI